ncbi:MAG: oxidoreductase, partial [Desulfobacteraceae bacterium]|nr:oxidoreductase [Desulfobacteraceae bacterium]
MSLIQNKQYTTNEINQCISILTHLTNNCEDFALLQKEQQINLIKAAGQLSRPDRHVFKQRNKAARKIRRQQIVNIERKARAATGIRLAREETVFSAPLQLMDK